MKAFIVETAILAIVALVVAKHFFRSRRAAAVLNRLLLAGWAYVAMVLLFAFFQVAREGW